MSKTKCKTVAKARQTTSTKFRTKLFSESKQMFSVARSCKKKTLSEKEHFERSTKYSPPKNFKTGIENFGNVLRAANVAKILKL